MKAISHHPKLLLAESIRALDRRAGQKGQLTQQSRTRCSRPTPCLFSRLAWPNHHAQHNNIPEGAGDFTTLIQ